MARTQKVVRSAVTGRFVKKEMAKKRPRTTVTETVKFNKPKVTKKCMPKKELTKVTRKKKEVVAEPKSLFGWVDVKAILAGIFIGAFLVYLYINAQQQTTVVEYTEETVITEETVYFGVPEVPAVVAPEVDLKVKQ